MPSLKAMAREAQNVPKGIVSKQFLNRKSTATLFKSAERVADSDIDSETESESSTDSVIEPTKTAPQVKKLNGHKSLQESPSSEEGSEEEESQDDEAEHRAVTKISDKTATLSDRESDNQNTPSESDISSENETDQEKDLVLENDPVTDEEEQSHASKESQAQSAPEPVAPYKPPEGFQLISTDDGRMKIADILSTSNLVGKQLWYITAPASVPINSVKQVSLEDVQFGRPALSLNGHEYGFVQEIGENRGHNNFLIPEKSNPAYCIGEKSIDQTLHLQQIVSITELSTNTHSQMPNSQNSTSILPTKTTYAKRPARKQPDGLKMRFRPIGFGGGKPGTIGSTSPSSDASSGGEDDTDKVMRDIHAPSHLYERLGSRTGEPERLPTPKGSRILPPQPLKRKHIRSEDTRTLKSPVKSSKANGEMNGTSLSTPKAQRLLDSSQVSTSDKSIGKPKPKSSPPGFLATPKVTKNTPIPPPRVIGARANILIEGSTKKNTPILPPRKTLILPSSQPKPASINGASPSKHLPLQRVQSPPSPGLPKLPSTKKSQKRSEKLHAKESKDRLERQPL